MEAFLFALCAAALVWWGQLALEWWFASRAGVDLADLPGSSRKLSLSVVVPARDEERNLEQALRSLLRALPEGGEVILVNDRSTDGTGTVARRVARHDARVRVLEVTGVPEGWIGKNHALQAGYEAARGNYILFTDADILFEPGCLARAVEFCEANGIDHLVATPQMVTHGFWENVFVLFFSVALVARFRIWRAPRPRSQFFAGIGAFNLVRKSAYERAGTHRALKGEVVDDLLLGRLVKRSGGRQQLVAGERCLKVRWNEGLGGLIRGLEKNAYAGFEYSVVRTVTGCAGMLAVTVVPALAPGLAVVNEPETWFGAGAALAGAGVWMSFAALYSLASRSVEGKWAYFPTFALGSLLLAWTIVRSAVLYHRRGGVLWRGTIYSKDSKDKVGKGEDCRR